MDGSGGQWAGDYESLYRSYTALARQVDHLSTLREIGLAISHSLELDETLTDIANVVQGALDVRRLTIFELDKEGQVVRPIIAKYGDDLISKERLEEEAGPLAGTPFGDVLQSKTTLLVSSDFQNAAYVPLVAKSAAVGVMRLEDRRDGHPFSHDDADLFQSIGSQIAIAINNAQLYALAVTDGLTKLYVRRYFDLRMDEEFEQARRYGRTFSMLLFDIDHFKKFNDTYGHQTGDQVLREFAELIRRNTRRSDICCRYGGEEIAVILPETRLEEAAVLANKLCDRVRNNPFGEGRQDSLNVTTSIGVAEYRPECEGPQAIVEEADAALYRAKELGRNRVELAGLDGRS